MGIIALGLRLYRTIELSGGKVRKMNRKGYILSFLFGIGIAGIFLLKLQQNCINKWKGLAEKNRGMFLLVDQWVHIKQEGGNLGGFFIKNNYKRIAIYGMGYVGMRLAKELEGTGIEVAYGIDRNAANIYSEIKLATPDGVLPEVDAVVVTTVGGFDEICGVLSRKVDCPVIAIEDIVNGM